MCIKYGKKALTRYGEHDRRPAARLVHLVLHRAQQDVILAALHHHLLGREAHRNVFGGESDDDRGDQAQRAEHREHRRRGLHRAARNRDTFGGRDIASSYVYRCRFNYRGRKIRPGAAYQRKW